MHVDCRLHALTRLVRLHSTCAQISPRSETSSQAALLVLRSVEIYECSAHVRVRVSVVVIFRLFGVAAAAYSQRINTPIAYGNDDRPRT